MKTTLNKREIIKYLKDMKSDVLEKLTDDNNELALKYIENRINSDYYKDMPLEDLFKQMNNLRNLLIKYNDTILHDPCLINKSSVCDLELFSYFNNIIWELKNLQDSDRLYKRILRGCLPSSTNKDSVSYILWDKENAKTTVRKNWNNLITFCENSSKKEILKELERVGIELPCGDTDTSVALMSLQVTKENLALNKIQKEER